MCESFELRLKLRRAAASLRRGGASGLSHSCAAAYRRASAARPRASPAPGRCRRAPCAPGQRFWLGLGWVGVRVAPGLGSPLALVCCPWQVPSVRPVAAHRERRAPQQRRLERVAEVDVVVLHLRIAHSREQSGRRAGGEAIRVGVGWLCCTGHWIPSGAERGRSGRRGEADRISQRTRGQLTRTRESRCPYQRGRALARSHARLGGVVAAAVAAHLLLQVLLQEKLLAPRHRELDLVGLGAHLGGNSEHATHEAHVLRRSPRAGGAALGR